MFPDENSLPLFPSCRVPGPLPGYLPKMSMEILSFLVGSILIGVAIIGGGFEVKEIKIPRVGAGVRVVSLFVGLGFIVLALALFGAGLAQRGVAGVSPGATALASGEMVDTAAPAPAGEEPAAPPADEPVQVDPFATSDAAPPATPEFGGFTGRTRVTWAIGETAYAGEMEMSGESGTVVVSYYDADGARQDVLEDLRLESTANGWFYSGSNPRFASTLQPMEGYSPDFFHVAPSGPGEWTFDQTCDANQCVAARVEQL